MFDKKEYQRLYKIKHRDYLNAYQRKWQREYHRKNYTKCNLTRLRSVEKLKREVLGHYGNGHCKCIKCGFSDIRALSIDHINHIGTVAKKKLGNRAYGYYFYLDLKRQGYPEGYQTLCMNCQRIKQVEKSEFPHK